MPRSLTDLARDLAPQYADLPPAERARGLADALGTLRPKADSGAVEAAANEAAGYDRPAEPRDGGARQRRPASGRPPSRRRHSPRRVGARAGRRAIAEVSEATQVSTFGRVFRTGLYLTALYWLLRSAGVVAAVVDVTGNAVRWLMDPGATIGQRTVAAAEAGRASAGNERPRETR